jgi:hypothetical protein
VVNRSMQFCDELEEALEGLKVACIIHFHALMVFWLWTEFNYHTLCGSPISVIANALVMDVLIMDPYTSSLR